MVYNFVFKLKKYTHTLHESLMKHYLNAICYVQYTHLCIIITNELVTYRCILLMYYAHNAWIVLANIHLLNI